MDCGDLDDIDNGGVVMSTSTIGSTATYTCEEGYDLSDDVERTCQADGSWDEDEPECICKYMHERSHDQLHKFIIIKFVFKTSLSYNVLYSISLVPRLSLHVCNYYK